jgi:hypothetical protein
MDTATLLDQLTRYERLPVEAIREAGERRAEMVPLFLQAIETFLADPHLEAPGGDGVFMMTHMLGSWHEKSAYRTIVRLLSDDPDRLDAVFGDALTESVPGVVLNIFDGDPGPLYALIENPDVDHIVRSDMIGVLATLVARGALARDGFVAWLRQAFTSLQPQGESYVWLGWQSAIALLGLGDLSALVRQVFDREWIDRTIMEFDDFASDLLQGSSDAAEGRNIDQRGVRPFGDTIETFSTWYGFSEEYLAKRETGEIEDDDLDLVDEDLDIADEDLDIGNEDLPLQEPVTNPFRHVGRNDPCPCGSGKKFKRCCLGKVA